MAALPTAAREPFHRLRTLAACLAITLLIARTPAAFASAAGKIQGRVLAAESGEPIGFADIHLAPADTTMKRVGGLTNADGTFLIEAAPGTYTLQVRALSYATRRVEGVVIAAGRLLPLEVVMNSAAIQQEQVVVEARARTSTDAAVLATRRKAAAVGDAIGAEQVRRSPDRDAGEVLRRVTGLTVADGKYVFVRGLGERYSSTEVDGVRIASPEQNRRVVPLDLLPANLIENVVVQKSYTADRPGEFGGGDVQVHTRDFPGARSWSLGATLGYNSNVTFGNRTAYAGGARDFWGLGAGDRGIPLAILGAGGGNPLVAGSPPFGMPKKTLASLARSFSDVWSPHSAYTDPNGSYAATYGDEMKLFGRSLGLIASANFSRAFDKRDESQRLFASGRDTSYDYAVKRSTASAQIGALGGLSYRLSPAHSLHLRGLFINSADDEVRTYEGEDHNRTESTTGTWIQHRDTRLLYQQRTVRSGSLEGQDQFKRLLGSTLDWKFTRSTARSQQPDRREVSYDNGYYYGPDGGLIEYWGLGSTGNREFGDMHDNGWGTTFAATVPLRLRSLGAGKLVVGYDRQTKDRSRFYRRFNLYSNQNADPTAPPESLFSWTAFTGANGTGYVEEGTLPQDNYRATSKVTAEFFSVDLPLHRRLRTTLGMRAERGSQDVRSFDLFHPGTVSAEGSFDNTDWLPSANFTWSATEAVNVRLAASRTLSRPDLNELSPSPSLEYVGGYRQAGNPYLHRALIDNYDTRVEYFPSASELFAAGFFYKGLQEPIEQSIAGAVPPLLVPLNSDHGRNLGVELEARTALGRFWGRMKGLALNANAAFISSKVVLKPQLTPLSDQTHPLQGQANYSVNVALTYAARGRHVDASVLLGAVGKRLRTLGYLVPDVYDQPTTSLDATLNLAPAALAHLKLSAKNLLDPRIQQLQQGREVSGYRLGRGFSLALSYGS